MASAWGWVKRQARRVRGRLGARADQRGDADARRDRERDAAGRARRLDLRADARPRRLPGGRPARVRAPRLQVDAQVDSHRADPRVRAPRARQGRERPTRRGVSRLPGPLGERAAIARGARALRARARPRSRRPHPDPAAIERDRGAARARGAAAAADRQGRRVGGCGRRAAHSSPISASPTSPRRWRAARSPTTTRSFVNGARGEALKQRRRDPDDRRPLQLDLRLRRRRPLRGRRAHRADRRRGRGALERRRSRAGHRRRRARRGASSSSRRSRGRKLRSADGAWLARARREARRERGQAARVDGARTPCRSIRTASSREVRDALPRDAAHRGRRRDDHGHRAPDRCRATSSARLLNAGTTGCMGTGVPYAIGAKLARPDAPSRGAARRLRVRRRGARGRDRGARRRAGRLRGREQRGHRGPRDPGRHVPARRAARSRACCPRTTRSSPSWWTATPSASSGPRQIRPALERALAVGARLGRARALDPKATRLSGGVYLR